MLSRARVMGLAAGVVARAFLDGDVARGDLWRASRRGARKFAAAVLAGDVVEESVAAGRARVCGGCGALTREASAMAGVATLWCGDPLACGGADVCEGKGGAVCGCLVGVSVEGELLAGGKTIVASERCPRGLWLSAAALASGGAQADAGGREL